MFKPKMIKEVKVVVTSAFEDTEVTAEIDNIHISCSGEQQVLSCEIGELLFIESLNVGDMLKGAWGCKGEVGEFVTLG